MKKSIYIFFSAVLVLEIISVLPDIQRYYWAKSTCDRSVLIRGIHDSDFSEPVGYDPGPSGAELCHSAFFQPVEKGFSRSVTGRCGVEKRARLPSSVVVRNGFAKNIKIHSVVENPARVMPDGGLDLKGKPAVLTDQAFKRPGLIRRIMFQCAV